MTDTIALAVLTASSLLTAAGLLVAFVDARSKAGR
jgi:hypothetical protein